MHKTRWFYTYKSTFKGLLFVIAMGLIIAQVWFTQMIVGTLREDQREVVRFYAGLYQKVIETDVLENYNFLFDNIIKKIKIPVILSSPDGEPNSHNSIENIQGPPYNPETAAILKDMMKSMDKENPPIEVTFNSEVISLIHFGDSELITLLNRLPVVQIVMVGLFILLGFIGFNNIRRNEQRYIWVGMAKETAHQLGTPISSLMGWIALLGQSRTDSAGSRVLPEMTRDVERLTKVAQRFSQIGSNSDMAEAELSGVLGGIVAYFRKRLPQSGNAATITERYRIRARCRINRDLFEWAVENLVKNSLDAIENGSGAITVTLDAHPGGKWFVIDIADTGKGMTKKQQKQVFKPGYSTKKRGWGLGLTLTKRIIENYHGGKLSIRSSRINEGTTMRIMLKGGA